MLGVLLLTPVTTGTDPLSGALSVLVNNGPLGACTVIIVSIMLMWQRREAARADRNEQALAELNRLMQDKIVPALGEAARALAEQQSTNREVVRTLGEIGSLVRTLPDPQRGRR